MRPVSGFQHSTRVAHSNNDIDNAEGVSCSEPDAMIHCSAAGTASPGTADLRIQACRLTRCWTLSKPASQPKC